MFLLGAGACRDVERTQKRWVDVTVASAYVVFDTDLVRACALAEDGEIRCFGCEMWMSSSWFYHLAPCLPPAGSFVDVDVDDHHDQITCGVREDGEVLCWGCDSSHEAGRCLSPGERLIDVAVGPGHNCGLDAEGRAVCWGGAPEFDPDLDTCPGCGVQEGPFVQIVPVDGASCGLESGGEITCWGRYDGPTLPRDRGLVAMHMTEDRGCGVSGDGELICWGWDTEAPAGRFVRVKVAGEAACAIAEDGGLHCWGEGGVVDQAPSSGTFEVVDLSDTTACAVDTSGEVSCWGTTNSALDDGPEPELRCH